MNIKELMIGNWVLSAGHDYYWNADDFAPDAEFLNQIEPIPLTPEWLEKLGFEEDSPNANTPYSIPIRGNIRLFVNPTHRACRQSSGVNRTSLLYPEYVHQLQNLYLSLTGKQLEVKQ